MTRGLTDGGSWPDIIQLGLGNQHCRETIKGMVGIKENFS
jgi:hypothetical protein